MRLAFVPALVAMLIAVATTAFAADKENTLYIDLKDGRVVIEMRPDLAPKHVAQIKKLAREGKYNGVVFHRVIEGFMAQTGDPDGTGMGGMGDKLPAEFSREPHVRGTVSMARTSDPGSRAQPVLHLLRAGAFARRPVHGVGQGRVGHGVRRQDQEGRARLGRRRSAGGQDAQGPGRRRRQELTDPPHLAGVRHGQGKHALYRPQGRPRRDRAAPRPRPQARRPDQEAGARGQV